MGKPYTDDELKDLTEEERLALEEGEETEDEELDEGEDGPTDEGDEGVDNEGADEGDASDDSGDDAPDEQEAAADDEEVEQPKARRDDEPPPILNVQAPDDADDRMAEITSQKDKLAEKFEDGDLTAKEYQQELDKLNKAEREIEQATFKAQLAEDMRQQQQRNAWLSTVNQFLDEHPDYREKKLLYKNLDMVVREIAADEANSSLSGREILERAHAQIQDELGIKRVVQEKPDAQEKPSRKSAPRPDLPPNLAKIPAADMSEVEDSRWAHLDKLMDRDPERYERELSKLSDVDREAYLSAM